MSFENTFLKKRQFFREINIYFTHISAKNDFIKREKMSILYVIMVYSL